MRTKIELLELLKSHIDTELNILGLCNEAGELYNSNRITIAEFSLLDWLIGEMRPFGCERAYYWKKSLKEPRIKAINELIKKIQDEN